MSYSQNNEDLFILEWCKGRTGVLLDIGANDGETFSNSKLLIENGWRAELIEPSSTFEALRELHQGNPLVDCFKLAIAQKDGFTELLESGAHVPGGTDHALVSTLLPEETKRWPGVRFNPYTVHAVTFKTFMAKYSAYDQYHFISIDAEGMDFQILQQIDLTSVGCQILCIEWNNNPNLKEFIRAYCHKHGMMLAYRNAENLIFVR